jgi:hypothetical protein
MRWERHIARMGGTRNSYKVLVGKPKGKRRFERPRCRLEDNIKMGLKDIGYKDVDWISLAQDRVQ